MILPSLHDHPRRTIGWRNLLDRNRLLVTSAVAVSIALILGIAGTTSALIQKNREAVKTAQANAQLDLSRFDSVKHDLLQRFSTSKPKTAEDFAAIGFAHVSMLDFDQGVKLLEHAQAIRNTPIFQLEHGICLGFQGFRKRDLQMLERAKDEITNLEARIGSDHRLFRQAMLQTARMITLVGRENGAPDDEALLPYADTCAERLMENKVPNTLIAVAWYYDHVRNDLDRAEQAWQRAFDFSSGDLYHTQFAALLLR